MNKKAKFETFYRNMIVDVSEKLFTENGYDFVSMEKIAEVAECSKSTLYEYFNNKEEIYTGIVLKGMKMLVEVIKRALDDVRPFEERFFGLCFAVSNFQENYPLCFEAVAGNIEVSNHSPKAITTVKEIFVVGEEINGLIAKLISDGITGEVFRKTLSMPQSVFSFWASLLGIVRIGGQDDKLIQKRMGITKHEFLNHSYETLLKGLSV